MMKNMYQNISLTPQFPSEMKWGLGFKELSVKTF